MNILSHSSQAKHKSKGFVIDHCILEYSKMKMKDPVNFIRSEWIRPEELHVYEDIGYHNFKLVERNLPTDLMVQRVKAYSNRSFNGNLIDLIQPYGHQQKNEKQQYISKKLFWSLSFLFKPFKVNILKLRNIQKLCDTKGMLSPSSGQAPIYIDNKKLDDFIQHFLEHSCRNQNCEECNYCHKITKDVIKIDEDLEGGNFWM